MRETGDRRDQGNSRLLAGAHTSSLVLEPFLLNTNHPRVGKERRDPPRDLARLDPSLIVDDLADRLAANDARLVYQALAAVGRSRERQVDEVCRSARVWLDPAAAGRVRG